jgi:hypothetical protein
MYKWEKAFWLSVAGTLLSLASLVAALLNAYEVWLPLILLGTIYIFWAWRVIIKE